MGFRRRKKLPREIPEIRKSRKVSDHRNPQRVTINFMGVWFWFVSNVIFKVQVLPGQRMGEARESNRENFGTTIIEQQ